MSEISSKLFRDDPAAYYTELGAQYERERIVKLLEQNWIEPMDWLTVEALIKGEQK